MDETELILLKRKLKNLKHYRGQGTQLISLYLPPDVDRSSVTKQLTDEISQSSNIKSAQTRKNVQSALKRITNYLKQIDFNLPETGLVLFSGEVSTNPSKSDIILLDIVPPKKLTTKLYWCDSSFHLLPLEEMAETDEVYGIIAVDKREATIAVLRGKSLEMLDRETSGVPGKTRAGGQSAHRFERLREKAAEDFFKRVGEKVNVAYLNEPKLKGMIIGGPGHTKLEFIDHSNLDHRIRDKILGTIDASYTDIAGIKEILDKSNDILKEVSAIKEKNLVNKFVENVAKNNLATYGFREVLNALNIGQADTVLISEGIEWVILKFKCIDFDKEFIKIVKDRDLVSSVESEVLSSSKDCDSKKAELLEEIDFYDFFVELTRETSSKAILISTESAEGKLFLDAFGGIGALLRYKI
ncbi:MAG: peptide chain release factor aRF-1 [Candidatus ainarchaeum sp.]|nr:peptide chain release factor aRF-1 [Candidatus ainarchaeum sp.]MDD3975977.1 peptide chain release factor aRF-1 [Candidatus ainarchaeum sp.]